jgi:hypothetical protein
VQTARFSGMLRMIQHVFAEIALPAVGARDGGVALGVAFPAAVDIIGRSLRDLAAGAAERVVILGQRARHRRLAALKAAGERCREEQKHYVRGRKTAAHSDDPAFRHCRA